MIKTEAIIFSLPGAVNDFGRQLGPLSTIMHSSIKNLGIIFDSLKFDKQISAVV